MKMGLRERDTLRREEKGYEERERKHKERVSGFMRIIKGVRGLGLGRIKRWSLDDK